MVECLTASVRIACHPCSPCAERCARLVESYQAYGGSTSALSKADFLKRSGATSLVSREAGFATMRAFCDPNRHRNGPSVGTPIAYLLDQLYVASSLSQVIRTDNGKAFCGRAMLTWAHERGSTLRLMNLASRTRTLISNRSMAVFATNA